MKGQLESMKAISTIIEIVILFLIGGVIINAIYNASVQTTGANSTATQAISTEANNFNLVSSLILFLQDRTHDIILALAVFGVLFYVVYKTYKNNNW